MAIVKMKRLRLLALHTQREELLHALQSLGPHRKRKIT